MECRNEMLRVEEMILSFSYDYSLSSGSCSYICSIFFLTRMRIDSLIVCVGVEKRPIQCHFVGHHPTLEKDANIDAENEDEKTPTIDARDEGIVRQKSAHSDSRTLDNESVHNVVRKRKFCETTLGEGRQCECRGYYVNKYYPWRFNQS
jgi:hypothetical protein